MRGTDQNLLGTWLDAWVILGENPPRRMHRVELIVNHDDDVHPWRLNWWAELDDDAYTWSRGVDEIILVSDDVFIGRHDNCRGPIAVIPLDQRDGPPPR